jgi:hypothetical protein
MNVADSYVVCRLISIMQLQRRLETRLSLAKFKVSRGWEHLKFESLEPAWEKEVAEKRRRANEELLALGKSNKAAAAKGKKKTQSVTTLEMSTDAKKPMGLFEHFLSPNRGPLPVKSGMKQPGIGVANNQPFSIPQSNLRDGGTDNQMGIGSSRMMMSPRTANYSPRFQTQLQNNHMQSHRDSADFVHAASALSSLSRGMSDNNVPATLGLTPSMTSGFRNTSRRRQSFSRASQPPMTPGIKETKEKDEESEESAAELMLYLAASPSPGQPRRTPGRQKESEGVKGESGFACRLGNDVDSRLPTIARKLFADNESETSLAGNGIHSRQPTGPLLAPAPELASIISPNSPFGLAIQAQAERRTSTSSNPLMNMNLQQVSASAMTN